MERITWIKGAPFWQYFGNWNSNITSFGSDLQLYPSCWEVERRAETQSAFSHIMANHMSQNFENFPQEMQNGEKKRIFFFSLEKLSLRSPLESWNEYDGLKNISYIDKQINFSCQWRKEALSEKQDTSNAKLKFKNNKIYHNLYASHFICYIKKYQDSEFHTYLSPG